MLEWTRGRLDEAGLWHAWLQSPAVRRFETGQGNEARFAQELIDEFELPVSAAQLLDEFAHWASGPLPGATELVLEVRGRRPVATLSNTNPIHHERLSRGSNLLEAFDRHFLSFRIGRIKPDPEIFGHVAEELGLPPARLLFLDDNPSNVEAARGQGLRARLARGVDEARQILRAELASCDARGRDGTPHRG